MRRRTPPDVTTDKGRWAMTIVAKIVHRSSHRFGVHSFASIPRCHLGRALLWQRRTRWSVSTEPPAKHRTYTRVPFLICILAGRPVFSALPRTEFTHAYRANCPVDRGRSSEALWWNRTRDLLADGGTRRARA